MVSTKRSIHGNLLIAVMAAMVWLTAALSPAAAEITPRPGWVVVPTSHPYLELTQRIANAAKRQRIAVVNVASATIGAERALNKKIPGNMVIGLYHPRFAIRTLAASIPAGIEAPIRMYVTENPDGTGTVSYKMPSFVFAPYFANAEPDLAAVAQELDILFEAVVKDSIGP